MASGFADVAGRPEAVSDAGAGRVTADGATEGVRGLRSKPQGEAAGEQGGGYGQFPELVAHDESFQGCRLVWRY